MCRLAFEFPGPPFLDLLLLMSCQTHCQIHRLQEFTDKMIAQNVKDLDYAALHKMATRVSVETLTFLEQWQQRFASGQEVVPLSFFKKFSQYLLPPLQRSSSVSCFEHSEEQLFFFTRHSAQIHYCSTIKLIPKVAKYNVLYMVLACQTRFIIEW